MKPVLDPDIAAALNQQIARWRDGQAGPAKRVCPIRRTLARIGAR